MSGDLIYFYDRLCWPSMSTAWSDGYPAICPDGLDPIEWRSSAKRLARHLACRVRTGLARRSDAHQVIAVANEGYPLGLVDPYERDAWKRAQCDPG